jgi:hypothetical protein
MQGGRMVKEKIKKLEQRIGEIKKLLQDIGEMRTGSLTRQIPQGGKGKGYYQISYTYKMKSKTEYVRPAFVPILKKQIREFRRFKKLIQEWIDCALEYSRLKIALGKKKAKGKKN